MRWPRRGAPRSEIPSEKGFLYVAGQDPDMPLRDIFLRFREVVSGDMDWADSRKRRFRKRASYLRTFTLLLTASATVVLGIEAIPSRAAIALPMVALVTVFGALESFHNWRSRWILMEEAQYRLNRLRDEIDYYIITTQPSELKIDRLKEFFVDQQATWNDVSRRWVEYRKLDRSSQGDQVTPNILMS